MGGHLLLDDGRQRWAVERWEEHLRYARQAVGDWGHMTEVVRLDDLESAHWEYFMEQCAVLHLTPVMHLATTFDQTENWWNAPPLDSRGDGHYREVAARYAAFVSRLEWPTEAHFVIVGENAPITAMNGQEGPIQPPTPAFCSMSRWHYMLPIRRCVF